MSDTPRTNRVTRARSEIASTSVVDSDFARTLERDLSAAQAEIERLREGLHRIAAIEDKMVGGDWEEIEEARTIARRALLDNPAEPGA